MRLFRKPCGAILAMGLVFALACVMAGCDSAGSQSTQYKPIESNILKKLGDGSQAQSDEAKAAHPPTGARKKR